MSKLTDFKNKTNKTDNFNLIGKVRVRLLVVLAFIVVASFFGQLVLASNLAVGGQELFRIDEQIKEIEAENMTLRIEIAKESALSNLAIDARELGFDKPSEVISPN